MYERAGYRTLLGRIRNNVRLYIRKQLELPRQEIAEILQANVGAMGEVAAARTDRELGELRATIDSDIRLLRERITEDVDPRRLARRNPLAVFGALASVIAIGGVTTMRGLSERNRRRSDTDIDTLIARLGGRIDKLRGRARKRLREQLRKEIGEVEQPPKPKQMFYEAIA